MLEKVVLPLLSKDHKVEMLVKKITSRPSRGPRPHPRTHIKTRCKDKRITLQGVAILSQSCMSDSPVNDIVRMKIRNFVAITVFTYPFGDYPKF